MLLLFLALISSALACSEWIPEYTPNPPQMTADWSNTQIVAGTETAQATATASPTASVTPTTTVTPTDTPLPTSSICELPTLGPGTYVWEVTPCP